MAREPDLTRARALAWALRIGIVYGKPANQGIMQVKFERNLRSVAEERVGRRCKNLRVLNSYWVNQVLSPNPTLCPLPLASAPPPLPPRPLRHSLLPPPPYHPNPAILAMRARHCFDSTLHVLICCAMDGWTDG